MLCAPALASCSIAYHEKAEDWLGLDLEKDVDRESLDRDKSQPVQKQLTNRAARDAFYDIADGLAAEELVAIEEGATKLGHLWLRALPYTKQLEMSDASFSSSLAIRTLVKETAPNCSSCGQEQRYRHPESCPHTNKLQTLRHDRVKGILYRAMRRTPGATVHLERQTGDTSNQTARISPSRVTCRRTGPGWILTSPSWDQPRPPSTPSSAPIGAESIPVAEGFGGYRRAVANTFEAHFRAESTTRKVARYETQVAGSFRALIMSNAGEAQDTAEALFEHWARVVPDWRTTLMAISIALQDTRARTHLGTQRGR